jgi:enoyl-CoA hydratase/carnithine racemase
MGAREALSLGLVGEVVPAAELMGRARELAEKIAQHSPTALARSKEAIWRSLDTGLDEGLEHAWRMIQEHVGHPDMDEGAQAFVERRKPQWKPYTGGSGS